MRSVLAEGFTALSLSLEPKEKLNLNFPLVVSLLSSGGGWTGGGGGCTTGGGGAITAGVGAADPVDDEDPAPPVRKDGDEKFGPSCT